MNKSNDDELSELKLLILELSQQFNRKFEDQAHIIRQQRDRLESQQQQLHNQCAIIEELAWQIRDLRDAVRKCNEKVSNVIHSKENVNSPESHLTLNIPDANNIRQSNHRAGRKYLFSHFHSLAFHPHFHLFHVAFEFSFPFE